MSLSPDLVLLKMVYHRPGHSRENHDNPPPDTWGRAPILMGDFHLPFSVFFDRNLIEIRHSMH